MNTVKYKFQTQADLMFYILNAAGHDFIHDFNNYGRMGKILQYIMGLVEYSVSPTAMIGIQAQSVVNELARQQNVDIQEGIREQALLGETPTLPTRESSSLVDYDITPSDQPAILSDRPDAIVVTPGNPPDQIKYVEPNRESDNDNPIDNSTQNITTSQLYESQKEENFISQPIEYVRIADRSSDNPIQDIVNENIKLYNNIAATVSSSSTQTETRSTTKKLNVMQRLKDFIQESKFLIISKLRSATSRLRSGTYRYGGKRQKGGSGIDVITRDDIIGSIKDIISEINDTKEKNIHLINYFEYIMNSYLYLSIPNTSPLEIFNNSLIEDSACIFIIGQCNNNNIREQANLCLTALLEPSSIARGISSMPLNKSKEPIDLSKFMARGVLPTRKGISYTSKPSRNGNLFGGAFNSTTYESLGPSVIGQFEELIAGLSETELYKNYNSTSSMTLPQPSDPSYESAYRILCETIYRDYKNFIGRAPMVSQSSGRGNISILVLICGPQMYNSKTTIIENKKNSAMTARRGHLKYYQEIIDTINDLIFVKTIDSYNDIKNRLQARNEDSGDGSSISGSAKTAVQKVSQLLAYKILELTGVPVLQTSPPPSSGNSDLDRQISILYEVAVRDKGYTSVDDKLIKHFIDTYGDTTNILAGENGNYQLGRQLSTCKKKECRVINNAAPSEVKSAITQLVVCPTSSVCDGMGSFGSCVNPSGNKEYANMNFLISFGDEKYSYYGQTNIKPDLTSVNINYGITYNNLKIYNFIDIKIDSQPIVLQANYVFKNLINRIIELWKISSATNIEELWSELYNTDYFLSILKLGSQKAVGDIFQEINSTLFNGGYNVPVQGVKEKNTYGLMGDRPSGVRVIKLLNNADGRIGPQNQGKNPRASGGYVGGDTTLIYFSQILPSGRRGGKKHKNISKTKKRRGNNKRQTKRRVKK